MAKKLLAEYIADELIRAHRISPNLFRHNRSKVQEIVERNLRRRSPNVVFNIIWPVQYSIDVQGIEYGSGRKHLRAMAAIVVMNIIEEKLAVTRKKRLTQQRRKSAQHTQRRVPRMQVAV